MTKKKRIYLMMQIVRDAVAKNPAIPVEDVQNALEERGFKAPRFDTECAIATVIRDAA